MVQLLRSITIDSAIFDQVIQSVAPCMEEFYETDFPKCLKKSIHITLTLQDRVNEIRMFRKYGRLIDNSIMRQYVNLIRNAQSYIYLENQYFIGSAYSWLDDQKTLAPHTIPR